MEYQFIGQSERIYPNIIVDARVLVAQPGDKYEFAEPPTDGLWVEITKPPSKPAKQPKEG